MTKVVVIVCFLTAFVAGLLVGRQARNQVATGPDQGGATTRPDGRPSRGGGPEGWLARELSLNDDQQKQLRDIWSETARMGGRERDDRRRQLRNERDEAIAALVRPEDYGKYDQILKLYREQTDAIDREMKVSFDASVEKTKQILTAEQRTKYEDLLKRHGPPDRDGRGRGRDGKDKDGSPPPPHGKLDHDQPSRRGEDPSATPRPTTAPTGAAPL